MLDWCWAFCWTFFPCCVYIYIYIWVYRLIYHITSSPTTGDCSLVNFGAITVTLEFFGVGNKKKSFRRRGNFGEGGVNYLKKRAGIRWKKLQLQSSSHEVVESENQLMYEDSSLYRFCYFIYKRTILNIITQLYPLSVESLSPFQHATYITYNLITNFTKHRIDFPSSNKHIKITYPCQMKLKFEKHYIIIKNPD